MNEMTIRTRAKLIQKLKELHFTGPAYLAGHLFLIYHGNILSIPKQSEFSIPQFRYLVKLVDEIISEEEWHF